MSSSSASFAVCMLPSCNKACHFDPITSIMHDFCGRTHAAEDAHRNGQHLAAPHGICHTCKLPGCDELVAFEEDAGRVHDFCCQAHATAAIEGGIHPRSNKPIYERDPANRCALNGCNAPKFVDRDTGRGYDYCGRSHARLASSRGQLPAPVVLGEEVHFGVTFKGRSSTFGCAQCPTGAAAFAGLGACSRCNEGYTLSTLTNAHPKYAATKQQFADSWQAVGPRPTVLRVLQVRNPASTWARYEAHKAGLVARGRPVNEERRFHATAMKCRFGIDQAQRPCDDDACAVCSIAATSFKLRFAGGGPLTGGFAALGGALRYGSDLYFSRVASKSHGYGEASERIAHGVTQRVMFLCKVALGTTLRTAADRLDEAQIAPCIAARGQGGTYDTITGLRVLGCTFLVREARK